MNLDDFIDEPETTASEAVPAQEKAPESTPEAPKEDRMYSQRFYDEFPVKS